MTNIIDLTGRRIVDFKITRKTKKLFRTSGWEIADGLIFDLLSTPFLSNDVKVPVGTVGVLFSGGYDSTALMIFYLEKGFTVLPISFLFNGSKERIGRLATLNQLRKIYGEKLLPNYEFVTEFYGDGDTQAGQQSLCHFWLRFLPDSIRNNLSKIVVGYNREDFGTLYEAELKELYKAGMKIKDYDYQSLNSIKYCTVEPIFPELIYPFKKQYHLSNIKIVNSFEEQFNVALACSSCESMEVKYLFKDDVVRVVYAPCGTCHKCKNADEKTEAFVDFYRVVDLIFEK